MKKTLLLLASAAMLVMANGCSCMNNTEKGAGIGGLLGAGIGTVVGAATGHPLAGAAIGGAVGAGTGALVGNDQDRADARYERQRQAINAARTPALSLQEIVAMSQRGVPESQIINQINASGAGYRLTGDDLIYLNDQRVSPAVISVMQSRPLVAVQPVQPVYVGPPRHRPVYVYDYPPPPPPPPIGFGVGVVVR
jgi:hypothetical protein